MSETERRWTLFGAGALLLVWPGMVAGAGLAYLAWVNLGTAHRTRWILAAGVGAVGVLSGGLVPIWAALPDAGGELLGQALLGPLVLQAAYAFRRSVRLSETARPPRVPAGGDAGDPAGGHRDRRDDERRDGEEGRPAGPVMLRLGKMGGRAYELPLPEALAQHVSIPGATGTGKTTTIVKISEDAVAEAGMAAVFADAKGTGSLRDAAEAVAARAGLPFRLVDPEEPDETMGYNPATGAPAQVSNKLVGAFSYGGGEVFKNVAQATIPQVAAALVAAGRPVNLETVAAHLNREAIRNLALKTKTPAAKKLESRFKNDERVQNASLVGMQARLDALRFGGYGTIFEPREGREDLDLAAAFKRGVTYVSLSAMASSEDSEIMARVLIQDAKQVAAARIRAKKKEGREPRPALLVLDEFAAFREADQIVDLLLQARESRITVVLSTQQVPESPRLRKAFLDAGLLICHRVETEDAQAVAAAMGKRRRANVTRYLGGEGAEDGDERYGSVRMEDRYAIDPDYVLGKLPAGRAAVQARYGTVRRQPAVVDIELPRTMRKTEPKEARG